MKRVLFAFGLVVLLAWVAVLYSDHVPDVSVARETDQPVVLDPDYTALVIPPNIAPMNFRIEGDGDDYVVALSAEGQKTIRMHCPDGTCRIPTKAWRTLLAGARGMDIHMDIFAKQKDDRWIRYRRVTNRVAAEPIDSYIVYRRLSPNRAFSTIRGIFQRDLESFDTSALLTMRDGEFTCFNCHTFYQNNPDKFIYHVRGKQAGMMLVSDGKVKKIETKQGPMFRPMAYASWHPDGKHIAATINMFRVFWPATKDRQDFESVEKRGDLVIYDIEQNTIITTPDVFENSYIETHPCWSADGKAIYFVRCKDKPLRVAKDLPAFKFDLMRIAMDVKTGKWGKPEMVKAYSELQTSCSFPRPSQDGRYVLHILADQTTYPIHQNSSDLYLLDLETKQHTRLDKANSDRSESYPRWSSNGRWFSFLSNRRDGISALPYFAYFDEAGHVQKAFVLPQKDPAYYDTFTDTYNVLEMVKSKVKKREYELARGMRREAIAAQFPQSINVDAYTGATPQAAPQGGHY